MHRTRLAALCTLVSGATLVAACSSSSSSSSPGASGGSGASLTTAAPGSSQTVTVALVGPFSGSEQPTGQQIRDGAHLAAGEINAAGGITAGPLKGDRIAFKEFDDADDPAMAASNMRSIVDDTSLVAAVGSGLSDASIAAAPIASQADVAYLAAYASSDKILAAATAAKSVFVVPPTFPAYAFSVADELVKAGHTKPAIIHLTGTYGDGIASLFVQELAAKGIRTVDNESFGFTDTTFVSQLAKIKAAGPDSLVLVGLADSDALILKQADQLSLKLPAYDPGGITNSQTFLTDAGPLANGVLGNSPSDAQRNTPAAAALRAGYTKATGQAVIPDPGAFSYEATKAVAAALADGASGRSDLVAHLHHIAIPDTGLGPLSFAADGSRIGGRLYIFTVTNGAPKFTGGYQQTGPMSIMPVPLER